MHVVEFSQNLLDKIIETKKEERLKVLASELAIYFKVQDHEVGLFKIKPGTTLATFLWPLTATRQDIQIPLSRFKGVVISKAAHLARGTINNQFSKTSHLQIIEQSLLNKEQCVPIQKLITATGFNAGQLGWIVQVARKGQTPEETGPDFTSHELKDLEVISQFIVGLPI